MENLMEVANAAQPSSNMKLAQAIASKCDDLSLTQNIEFEFRMQHHFKLPYEDGVVDADITNCSHKSLWLMWDILKDFTTEREKRQRERALEKAARRKEAAREAALEASKKRKREAQANARKQKKLKFIVKCSIALP
jgi:hypothetical protein